MTRVAVAATGQQALEAGLAIAGEGGNAVDAALAAAFVALATEPGMVSLGGGASSRLAGGRDPVVVDGNVEMPGRGADPERFGGGVRGGRHRLRRRGHHARGPRLVATPGRPGASRSRPSSTPPSPGRAWSSRRPAPPAATRWARAAARYLSFVADTLFALDPEAHALVTGDGGTPLDGGEERSNAPRRVLPAGGRGAVALHDGRRRRGPGRAWRRTTGW